MGLTRQTEVWIVSVQRVAHIKQCRALAEAAGLLIARTVEIAGTTATDHKLLKYIDVAKSLLKCVAIFLKTPLPRGKIVICSGRSISLLVWFWKKILKNEFYCIYVGHAKSPLVYYDVMLIPQHDVPLMEKRRVPPPGVLVETTTGILAARKSVAYKRKSESVLVCIGGDNISFSYQGEAFIKFLQRLTEVQANNVLHMALSGRTTTFIRDLLATYPSLMKNVIQAKDREGFAQAQAEASSIFVCPDSVTMISEALTAGATVYVPRLEVLNPGTSDYLFVEDCRNKRYISDIEEFPQPHKNVEFPDALARVLPVVLKGMNYWQNRSKQAT